MSTIIKDHPDFLFILFAFLFKLKTILTSFPFCLPFCSYCTGIWTSNVTENSSCVLFTDVESVIYRTHSLPHLEMDLQKNTLQRFFLCTAHPFILFLKVFLLGIRKIIIEANLSSIKISNSPVSTVRISDYKILTSEFFFKTHILMFLTPSSIKYLNINILKIKPQNFYQFLFQDTIKMTTPIANNELKKKK